MYTKHVRQKRKVYHDGFLVLQSSRNKVLLYDEVDNLLDTKFVKKDDIIRSGETVTFDSHLVDLGELCQRHQPKFDVISQVKGNKAPETSSSFYSNSSQNKRLMAGKGKRRVVNLSPSKKMIRDFMTSELNKLGSSPKCMDTKPISSKGKPPGAPSECPHTKLSNSRSKTENTILNQGYAEPRRSVSDILSILRQPSEGKVVPVNKPNQNCAESHSSKFHLDTKNYIKEYAKEGSGTTREELGGEMSEHDGMIKVIKSEPVETVIDVEECGVSENGKASQARSSSFHLRSQKMKFKSPSLNVQSTNLDKSMSSSSSVESYATVTAAQSCDDQKEVVSESLTESYANNELENTPIICSSEEIMTETNPAAANGLNSTEFPEVEEDKNGSSSRCNDDLTSHNLDTEDMDEYPSFDLGI